MKMIAGWVQPDSGTIEIGQTVKMGYFSQENEAMDESLKVIDYIKNVAEYVQNQGWKRQCLYEGWSVSYSHPASSTPPLTVYLAVRSGDCTCCGS